MSEPKLKMLNLGAASEPERASGRLIPCAISPRPSVKLGHFKATLPYLLARRDEMLGLSVRERQALILFAQGLSGPQVAIRMGVTQNTIDTYRRRIFHKTGAKTTAEAVAVFAAHLLGAKLEQE
jgi:DNA-binding CsgD family transcriptional regulator